MTGTRATPMTAQVMSNVAILRHARGWTAQQFSERIAVVFPSARLSRSQIANLEAGYRTGIVLEELAAFAVTLGMDPWSLTSEPVCLTCRNNPPTGFLCTSCRREAL